MIYTCPKCGKKMDLSTELLINSGYKVICPQCLCELHIVGDYAYIPNDTLELDTSVEPSRTINCPGCGHEVNSNAHFCPNCGTSFDSATDAVMVDDVSSPSGDPLYDEAVQFLSQCSAITPMMLRDRFHISDERAAQLIRQLEAGGIIGPYNNGGPRQILIPHNSAYPYMPRRINPGGNSQSQSPMADPAQGTPQPRRLSCLTWILIMVFFIYLMKACGA